MNTIYIGKFCYTFMITLEKKIQTSTASDEGPRPKLALSKSGNRGNIESQLLV